MLALSRRKFSSARRPRRSRAAGADWDRSSTGGDSSPAMWLSSPRAPLEKHSKRADTGNHRWPGRSLAPHGPAMSRIKSGSDWFRRPEARGVSGRLVGAIDRPAEPEAIVSGRTPNDALPHHERAQNSGGGPDSQIGTALSRRALAGAGHQKIDGPAVSRDGLFSPGEIIELERPVVLAACSATLNTGSAALASGFRPKRTAPAKKIGVENNHCHVVTKPIRLKAPEQANTRPHEPPRSPDREHAREYFPRNGRSTAFLNFAAIERTSVGALRMRFSD